MTDERVPVLQVLDDMYGDKGPVSWAAKDYYKMNYATPDERKSLEREERAEFIFAACVWVAAIVGIVVTIILEVV